MPSPSAPIVTAASPGEYGGSRAQAARAGLVAERGDRGDEVERRAHRAFRVVLGRRRRAPDGHHRVADELLDRAAVERDQAAARVEIAREQLARLLRVTRLGRGREADEIGEEHGDEAALRDRRGDGLCREGLRDLALLERACRMSCRTACRHRSPPRRPDRLVREPSRTHRKIWTQRGSLCRNSSSESIHQDTTSESSFRQCPAADRPRPHGAPARRRARGRPR